MIIVWGSSHLSTVDPVEPVGSCTCYTKNRASGSAGTAEDLCNIFHSQSRKHHFLERLCEDRHSLFISSQSWEHTVRNSLVIPTFNMSATLLWIHADCRTDLSFDTVLWLIPDPDCCAGAQSAGDRSPGHCLQERWSLPVVSLQTINMMTIQLRVLSYTASSRSRVLTSSPVSCSSISGSDWSRWGHDRWALFNPPGTYRPPSTGPCRSAELHMPPCWCG